MLVGLSNQHTMSRKLIIHTGILTLILTLVGATPASALSIDSTSPLLINRTQFNLDLFVRPLEPGASIVVEKPKPPERKEPEAPKPVEYSVVNGDNLTKIAEAHGTTWLRLWQKNTSLDNPDLIFPGQVFLIPDPNEQLADRPVPERIIAALAPAAAVSRGSVAGNTYDAGYCTWYVKNRRPDLPNNLGNANTWYSRAAAQGYAVGSTPRAGAVGTTTAGDLGHVIYVERVNGDGSITISEMNYAGLYSQRTRTASASEFAYIY